MKKLALTFLFLGYCLAYAGNITALQPDTVTVKKDSVSVKDENNSIDEGSMKVLEIGNNKISIYKEDGDTKIILKKNKRDNFHGHWEGLEFGLNMFMDNGNKIVNDGPWEVKIARSWEISLNLLQYDLPITRNLGLVSGIGFTFNDYHFTKDISIDNISDYTTVVPLEEANYPDLKKSKYSVSYLTVPLLLEFQSAKNNTFISLGVEAGLKLGDHTKIKYGKHKDKDRGDFNANQLRYSSVVRLGLDRITFFAKYSMSELFKSDKGPELHPFSIGICFN